MFYQNLNERPDGTTGFPRHARMSIGRLRFSWQVPTGFFHVTIARHTEGWTLSLGCLLFAVWLTLERFARRNDRELRFSIHDWCLWWNLWTPSNEWSSKTPRYRYGSLDLLDLVLGRSVYSKTVLAEASVLIPLPERTYRGHAKLFLARWTRPRWFTKFRKIVEIECAEPVPIPGKGENSWDCGDDAIHSLSTQARSIEEGVAHLVQSALETRRRHGGGPTMPGVRVA